VGDGGVELLRGEDQAVSEVRRAAGDDRGRHAVGIRPEVGDQHAVVGQGRGEVDAAIGLDEARELLDRGAQRRDLDRLRPDGCLAPREDVGEERPAPLEGGVASVGTKGLQDLFALVIPGQERDAQRRGRRVAFPDVHERVEPLLPEIVVEHVEERRMRRMAGGDAEEGLLLGEGERGVGVVDDDRAHRERLASEGAAEP
jgi:hypothetical protein